MQVRSNTIMLSNIIVIVIFNLFVSYVWADNFTSVYKKVPYENGPKHQPRFLSFNTQDNGDLTIDLEFAVPFLSIPVKKTVDAAMGIYHEQAIANINIGSIFLAGAVVLGAVFVIPFVTSLFVKHALVSPSERSETSNDSWRIMMLLDQVLIENNIDTTTCMQRTMCWLTKNARNKLNSGEASSQDKIIDGLVSNSWINQMIEGSAIQTAIRSGLENNNCANQYKNCKINVSTLQLIAKKFANFINYNK